MRRTLQSTALVLALSIPIYAGDMQFPVAGPPPPPTPVQEAPTYVGIQTPQTTDDETRNVAAATFVEIMLSLLALS